MPFCRTATVLGLLLTIYGVGGLIYVFGFQYSDIWQFTPDQLSPEENSAINRALAESVRKTGSVLLAGLALGALGEIGAALRRRTVQE